MLPKAAEPSVPAFKEHSEHSSKRSPSDLAHQVKRKTKRKVKTAAANASGKSEQDAQKAQEVSFNPLDKVVKYSEDAPVSQMKGSAVKRKRRRLQDLESTPGTDPKQGKKSSKRRKK